MIMHGWRPKPFHELTGLSLRFRASAGFWQVRRGTGLRQSCRSQLSTEEDTVMSEVLGEPLGSWGFMKALHVLDCSMVYLKGSFHLHYLPKHKLSQVACAGVCARPGL